LNTTKLKNIEQDMEDNLGAFSVLPTEIRRLLLQKWISVANILK